MRTGTLLLLARAPAWLRHACCFCALALLPLAAPAQQLAADYQQVLHPVLAQQAVLEDAHAAWDALHFSFAQGEMGLAAPLHSRETTAVFRGRGSLEVAAPNPIERQQMKFLGGKNHIAVDFTQAVFRFGDGAAWRQALGGG
ncbi:MAG: hypothetical protein ACRD1E_08335, partial [Terriglobales bacterium]